MAPTHPVGEEALVDLLSQTTPGADRQLGTPSAAVQLWAGGLSGDWRPRPGPTTALRSELDSTLLTQPLKSPRFPGLTSDFCLTRLPAP